MPDGHSPRVSSTRLLGQDRRGGVILATVTAASGTSADIEHAQFARGAQRVPSTVALDASDVGAKVAVTFIDGDLARPLIIGRLLDDPGRLPAPPSNEEVQEEVQVVEAERELVLRCGEASIVLQANGRIVAKGKYVETYAKGVNRIKGAAVQIN